VLTVGAEELGESLGQGRMGLVSAHAFAAQRRAVAVLERHVSGPYRELSAAVAASVVFGVHAAPPPAEITEVFRRAGTIHLLVVSGAMVSMVLGMVLLPGALGAGWRRMRAERQFGWPVSGRGRIRLRPGLWAAVIGMLVVTYYAVLTEGGQAVARAAIMGVLVGLAFALRRVPAAAREHGLNVDHYTLLAAAALGILAIKPAALSQAGFQLSFAAVWAIIYLIPKAAPLFAWLPRWVGLTLVGTVAAQLATFPILAWHYGQAPIAGFGANLFAIPLAGIVLVAAMLTCALGVVAPWLAPAAGWVTGVAARWMVWVSSAFASLPGASLEVARPGLAAIIVWYAGMVAMGWGVARLGARFEHETAGQA
jgi:competence protein ComEC